MSIISKACVGKTSCQVSAEDTVFGDPCKNVLKHLYVQVQQNECLKFFFTNLSKGNLWLSQSLQSQGQGTCRFCGNCEHSETRRNIYWRIRKSKSRLVQRKICSRLTHCSIQILKIVRCRRHYWSFGCRRYNQCICWERTLLVHSLNKSLWQPKLYKCDYVFSISLPTIAAWLLDI
jgi:hypothetical protein